MVLTLSICKWYFTFLWGRKSPALQAVYLALVQNVAFEELADILGCEMNKFPTVYFSLGMKKKDKNICPWVTDR